MILEPETIAKSGTEHAHQCAFMQWVALYGVKQIPQLKLLFAIPNGGDRMLSVAASLKAEGMKSGVPDLFLPIAVGTYFGLWIEMKRPTKAGTALGGRTTKQVEWHKALLVEGHAVVVCYTWKQAVWALRRYWEGDLMMPDSQDALLMTEVMLEDA